MTRWSSSRSSDVSPSPSPGAAPPRAVSPSPGAALPHAVDVAVAGSSAVACSSIAPSALPYSLSLSLSLSLRKAAALRGGHQEECGITISGKRASAARPASCCASPSSSFRILCGRSAALSKFSARIS